MEKVKTWVIVGLFIICFFGFMIFGYKYKNLNEQYEKAIKETVDYQHVIDSLLLINKNNDSAIFDLNEEVNALTIRVTDLTKERERLLKKIEKSQVVVSNNISVATTILKGNLSNETL